jgi:hypothetical protein
VRLRQILVSAIACLGIALPATVRADTLPPIKHVFVIVLENKGFAETFGNNSPAQYLAKTLTSEGALIPNYYGTVHNSWGNYIAMTSGQAGNIDGQADCQFFSEFSPATAGADGQFVGQGCVYPASVKSIGDQLQAKGLTWKGYMEDMGNSASQPKTCRHPALGAQDTTQSAHVGDQYAARHNPFVYYHAIIDNQARCDAHVVPLDRLPADLGAVSSTPNYTFISPNLCNDGHDKTCVDGKQGGLAGADAFLRLWVPRLTGSAAYKQDGLLLVLFDEGPAGPPGETTGGDASACPAPCQSPAGPNTPNPGALIIGPGGGKVGAVALSSYIRPGTISARPYNHYSLLRSVEDLFGLGHLAYAGLSGQTAFGSDIYTGGGPTSGLGCAASTAPLRKQGRLARGALLAQAIVRRGKRGRKVLKLRFTRGARLSALARPPRRRRPGRHAGPRKVGPKRVRACRTFHVRLPYRHGRVSLRVSVGRAAELRTVRF